MRLLIILLLTLCINACGGEAISKEQVDVAIKLCKVNDGYAKIYYPSPMGQIPNNSRNIEITCNNGAYFFVRDYLEIK